MTITFACKTIKVDDLIKCAFNLTKTEFNVLMFLLKQKEISLNSISQKLKLERTSIQKAVKSLLSKDLVTREKKLLDKGGYIFIYSSKNKTQIKKQISDLIDSWSSSAKRQIKNL